jgi:mannose-6-phosphate isomerase-like protein (cupin superfamily)
MNRFQMLRWAGMTALVAAPMLAAAPQAAAPEGFQHWTAASFVASAKELAGKSTADPHHAATLHLADFPNDYFLLAHREADGQAEWHETEADVFVVQSGAATLVVGGTITNPETSALHEKRGNTIEGGSRQKLAKGDVVRIPAKTAHQLLLDGGHEFTYFVVKVKGY